MKLLKRLFCKHYFVVKRWHFTHGQLGNEPHFAEGFKQCKKCGKERYFWVERNSEFEKCLIENMKDRYE